MPRDHNAFTLLTTQVVGSIAVMLARAIAPDNEGPGDVFPDFSYYRSGDSIDVFRKSWFFVGLFCQIIVCMGYFLFSGYAHVPRVPLTFRSDLRSYK
jgi:alpha-1,3-glucan synthase